MMTISNYFRNISFYPDHVDAAVKSIIEEVSYEDKYLFEPGRICPYIWFLQNGLVGIRENRGDKEIYHWLLTAPAIIIEPNSSLDGIKPATMFIEPLEPCLTQRALMADVNKVKAEHPEFDVLYRKINAEYRRLQNEREADLRALEAEDRFFKLYKESPGLFTRTPHKILMNYINISYNKFYQCKKELPIIRK